MLIAASKFGKNEFAVFVGEQFSFSLEHFENANLQASLPSRFVKHRS